MASKMIVEQRYAAPVSWDKFTGDITLEMHHLRYAVRAAAALLNASDGSESDEDVVGARFLLRGLEQHCEDLALRFSDAALCRTTGEVKAAARRLTRSEAAPVADAETQGA